MNPQESSHAPGNKPMQALQEDFNAYQNHADEALCALNNQYQLEMFNWLPPWTDTVHLFNDIEKAYRPYETEKKPHFSKQFPWISLKTFTKYYGKYLQKQVNPVSRMEPYARAFPHLWSVMDFIGNYGKYENKWIAAFKTISTIALYEGLHVRGLQITFSLSQLALASRDSMQANGYLNNISPLAPNHEDWFDLRHEMMGMATAYAPLAQAWEKLWSSSEKNKQATRNHTATSAPPHTPYGASQQARHLNFIESITNNAAHTPRKPQAAQNKSYSQKPQTSSKLQYTASNTGTYGVTESETKSMLQSNVKPGKPPKPGLKVSPKKISYTTHTESMAFTFTVDLSELVKGAIDWFLRSTRLKKFPEYYEKGGKKYLVEKKFTKFFGKDGYFEITDLDSKAQTRSHFSLSLKIGTKRLLNDEVNKKTLDKARARGLSKVKFINEKDNEKHNKIKKSHGQISKNALKNLRANKNIFSGTPRKGASKETNATPPNSSLKKIDGYVFSGHYQEAADQCRAIQIQYPKYDLSEFEREYRYKAHGQIIHAFTNEINRFAGLLINDLRGEATKSAAENAMHALDLIHTVSPNILYLLAQGAISSATNQLDLLKNELVGQPSEVLTTLLNPLKIAQNLLALTQAMANIVYFIPEQVFLLRAHKQQLLSIGTTVSKALTVPSAVCMIAEYGIAHVSTPFTVATIIRTVVSYALEYYDYYKKQRGEAIEDPEHYLNSNLAGNLTLSAGATLSAAMIVPVFGWVIGALSIGGTLIHRITGGGATSAAEHALTAALANIHYYNVRLDLLKQLNSDLIIDEKFAILEKEIDSPIFHEYIQLCQYAIQAKPPSSEQYEFIKNGAIILIEFDANENDNENKFFIYHKSKSDDGHTKSTLISETLNSYFQKYPDAKVIDEEVTLKEIKILALFNILDYQIIASHGRILRILNETFSGIKYSSDDSYVANMARAEHLRITANQSFHDDNYQDVLKKSDIHKLTDDEGLEHVYINDNYQLPAYMAIETIYIRFRLRLLQNQLKEFHREYNEYAELIYQSSDIDQSWYESCWDGVRRSLEEFVIEAYKRIINLSGTLFQQEEVASSKSLLSLIKKDYKYCQQWPQLMKDEMKLQVAQIYAALGDEKNTLYFLKKINDPKIRSNFHSNNSAEIVIQHAPPPSPDHYSNTYYQALERYRESDVRDFLEIFQILIHEKDDERKQASWILMYSVLVEINNLFQHLSNHNKSDVTKNIYAALIVCIDEIMRDPISHDDKSRLHLSKIEFKSMLSSLGQQAADRLISSIRESIKNNSANLGGLLMAYCQLTYEDSDGLKHLYRPIDVPGDDNCAFHAMGINRQTAFRELKNAVQAYAADVRANKTIRRHENIINLLKCDIEYEKNHANSPISIDEIHEHIRKYEPNGVWMSYTEGASSMLDAIACLFKKNLRIFRIGADNELAESAYTINSEDYKTLNILLTSANGFTTDVAELNHYIMLKPGSAQPQHNLSPVTSSATTVPLTYSPELANAVGSATRIAVAALTYNPVAIVNELNNTNSCTIS